MGDLILGLRTATIFTVYGHRNTAAVTVPWPNLSSQSRFGVGTVDCRMCRRYAAAYGRALTVKSMPEIPKLPYGHWSPKRFKHIAHLGSVIQGKATPT